MSASALARVVALLLLAVTVTVLAQASAAPDAIALTPQRVSEHGWFFQGEPGMASAANRGFMSNAGFVVTREGVVVFDALGTPVLGAAMVAAIRKVTSQPIRRVIVSHYHADHVYGLQPLKAAGAEVWAHRDGDAYFTTGAADQRLEQRRRALHPWVDERTRVLQPDLWLEGDTDFRMGGLTFRVVHAGGAHSPEDVMVYVVEERLLFAG